MQCFAVFVVVKRPSAFKSIEVMQSHSREDDSPLLVWIENDRDYDNIPLILLAKSKKEPKAGKVVEKFSREKETEQVEHVIHACS